jgi:glycosyltransferase involved in cell wall biosynthesis
MKPKLLWIGDAVVQTGFARVTHNVLAHLTGLFDIHVLGVGHLGDPCRQYPYDIYPASLGGDAFGFGRVKPLCDGIQPDLICINNDPWNVTQYLQEIPKEVPVVAYMPVDAPNQGSAGALTRLSRAIAYTNFGRKELYVGGFNGRCDVIPHGVDTATYYPTSKEECRARLKGLPNSDDVFIVSNVNRNQPRKRLDLTIQYWANWWIKAGQPKNAFLALHCTRVDLGWNVDQLAKYYGIEKNFFLVSRKMTHHTMVLEHELRLVYGLADVNLSTTLGEGWGLTQMESMACGIANAVPRYSALGEWPNGAVEYTEVDRYDTTPSGINTIGGVPSLDSTVAAIDKLYRDRDYREDLGRRGRELVTQSKFNWTEIAKQFASIFLETISERQQRPMGL